MQTTTLSKREKVKLRMIKNLLIDTQSLSVAEPEFSHSLSVNNLAIKLNRIREGWAGGVRCSKSEVLCV